MILRALYDYYHRLKAIDSSLAPNGFKEQEIPFLIVIDKEGNFLRIEDRRIDKKNSQKFLVVADSRSSGIKPYLLYDNLEYVLGHPKDDKKNTVEKAPLKHDAFVAKCKELHDKYPDCEDFAAVMSFYEKGESAKVKEDELWEDAVKKVGANVSFLLQGQTEIAASVSELEEEVNAAGNDGCSTDNLPVCLVTGHHSPIVEITTTTAIPGGNQATAKLVAFQVNSGYDSYGKSKGNNAPISKEAEAAYTTALLRLTGKQSRNKFYIGNRTFLFWASSNSESAKAAEESMFNLFGFSKEKEDDPNRRIELVRSTFMSIYNGKLPSTSDDRFYILGLAPNAARIAVVYWNETTVHDFAGMILKHFDDMEIVDGRKEKRPYYGLHQMMSAVTLGGKASDVQPNLPEATMNSILQGLPYPYTLFASAIRRIRAELKEATSNKERIEQENNIIARHAIIKAYLNRQNNNDKSIKTMLDKQNTDAGYLCGRLFAVLDRKQEKGSRKDSSKAVRTIRERYMNSASSTPVAVFARAINLAKYYEDKLEEKDKIFFERLTQEILDKMPNAEFPPHLSLQEQGRFFIGYYQQRQDFFQTQNNESEDNQE